jgi:sorting nexin-29
LQQITAKRRDYNLPTYNLFIDYKKAYDNVDREILWKILTDNGIPTNIIATIQSLYKNIKICIKLLNHKMSKILNLNKGVRQGCGLSPTLFNLSITQLTREWKSITTTGFKICNNKTLKTMLYADDQIILAKTDKLQIAANTLNEIARKYSMKTSTTKTQSMAVCGKNMQRAKIVIDDTIIVQVTDFMYLGNMISEFKIDITIKILR